MSDFKKISKNVFIGFYNFIENEILEDVAMTPQDGRNT
jgi:hypothetical protein